MDRVEKDCGRGGCHWSSYGHYDVAGVYEEDVIVASDRNDPAWDPQTILVDPANPRSVVNTKESDTWMYFFAPLSLVVGVTFLIVLVRGRVKDLNSGREAEPA